MKIQYLHAENLIIDCWHPARGSDAGVLRIHGTGQLIDASVLRSDPRSKIFTDEPETICRLLGIRFPDAQVIEK
jgi:hypothetical protein